MVQFCWPFRMSNVVGEPPVILGFNINPTLRITNLRGATPVPPALGDGFPIKETQVVVRSGVKEVPPLLHPPSGPIGGDGDWPLKLITSRRNTN